MCYKPMFAMQMLHIWSFCISVFKDFAADLRGIYESTGVKGPGNPTLLATHILSPSRTIKHSEVLKDPPLLLLPHSPTTLLASHTLRRPAERSQRKRETEMEKRMNDGFPRTIGMSNAKSDWNRCMDFEVIFVPLKYLYMVESDLKVWS